VDATAGAACLARCWVCAAVAAVVLHAAYQPDLLLQAPQKVLQAGNS
jgi:hypothetical protein